MIVYENSGWIKTVVTFTGSVWPNIRLPLLLWALFVVACNFLFELRDTKLGNEGHTIFCTTMSFLLIFRANQAYARYWQGRTCVSNFFTDLRSFNMMAMQYIHGGVSTVTLTESRGADRPRRPPEDESDVRARKLRVDLVRLIIAYAVSLKMYTRIAHDGYCHGSIDAQIKWSIDWDRLRLRQLLYDEEFRSADECLGIKDPIKRPGKENTDARALVAEFKAHGSKAPSHWPSVFEVETQPHARMYVPLVFKLRELLMVNMNDIFNTVPHGIKERFIPILSGLVSQTQENFESIGMIISTPLPLPYACLCKTLLTIWMVSFPFTLDWHLGIFGSIVIPVLIGLALFGIDAISTELENPFGDDDNDLDLLEAIHALESEAMEFLTLCGDDKARASFVWRRMPGFISDSSCKPVAQYLAVRELAAEDFIMPDSAASTPRSSRGGGSHRSRSASGSGSIISASSLR